MQTSGVEVCVSVHRFILTTPTGMEQKPDNAVALQVQDCTRSSNSSSEVKLFIHTKQR